jgi:ABC-type sugar transport system substrate-binding protein
MKLSRRGLISVVPALAASTIGLAAPARADTKEIVYLTPSLDLPFWRYLSNGIESEAKTVRANCIYGRTMIVIASHRASETPVSRRATAKQSRSRRALRPLAASLRSSR